MSINPLNSGGITAYGPISGGSTKTEIPPIYRTYKNTGVNEAKIYFRIYDEKNS